MTKLLLAAAALGTLALSGPASAQAPARAPGANAPQARPALPPRPHGRMARYDANGDGIVTRAEVIAAMDRAFAKIDANRDGRITAAEFEARRQRRAEKLAERGVAKPMHEGKMRGDAKGAIGRRMDPNRDGAVTEAEFRGRGLAQFDRLDANRDGRLDAAERNAPPPARRAGRGPQPGGRAI